LLRIDKMASSRARRAVDRHRHMPVAQGIGLDRARQRRQDDTFAVRRPVAGRSQFQRPLAHLLRENRWLGEAVHQAPGHRLFAANAFGGSAEHVGEVVANPALVGEPRQPAGAGQHAQQRHLRQADGRGAVVDEPDLVAGQGQFVAAAGAGAVDGGQELQPRMAAGVLDAVAGLVGEPAEVHFPRVRRQAEHEDVGAGAEDPFLQAGDDDRAHLGMLEADAVQRVGEFDVDAEVVAVELQLVAGAQAGVLGDVHRQRRHRAVEREPPVAVARWVGLVVDAIEAGGLGRVHGASPNCESQNIVLQYRFRPRRQDPMRFEV
jgi:hypothetical protein